MEDVTYLWVAEAVLRKHRRPLAAGALVNYGLEDELFPASGLSRTPQKSMQARLSMDILNNPKSMFVRTGKGRFFLRDLLSETAYEDGAKITVYQAVRRAPPPPTEMVLCVPKESYQKFLNYQGIGIEKGGLYIAQMIRQEFVYLPRSVAEISNEYKQVITYTIIQYEEKILSFRRGLYNRAAKFLRGAQCVGFGGHVSDDDRNLFSQDDLGIRHNAAREISEELVLPAGRPVIDPDSLEILGVLNDDSSDVGVRHMAVILRYRVDNWTEWKAVRGGEVSINRIKWLSTIGETINLSEFEYWSQIVIRTFFQSSMRMVPSYKIQKKSWFKDPHILCVVGSIGSGKSATSNLLREHYGYAAINSGRVLAQLLEIPAIPSTERAVFQAAANEFISRPDGPRQLGIALAKAAGETGCQRVLIDGIRHPETLEALRREAELPVSVLYVYTPPDVAFAMYKDREGHGEDEMTFATFVQLYTAPVESRIRYLVGEADIITFNWLGLEAYEKALTKLMEELYGPRV